MTGKITDRYRDELCAKIASSARGYFSSKEKGADKEDVKNIIQTLIGLSDNSEIMQPLADALVDIGYNASSSDEAYEIAYAKCLEYAEENPIVLKKNPNNTVAGEIKLQRAKLEMSTNLECFIVDNEISEFRIAFGKTGKPNGLLITNIQNDTIKIPMKDNSFDIEQVQDCGALLERKLEKLQEKNDG